MRKAVILTLLLLFVAAGNVGAVCPDIGVDSVRTIWSARCQTECPNDGCTGYADGHNCATYTRTDACCTWCNRLGQCIDYYGNYAEVTTCFS